MNHILLSPFVTETASEVLNEKRECKRPREASSSQSTTSTHTTAKRGFDDLDMERIAKVNNLYASNKKAKRSSAKNSPRMKEMTLIPPVPSAGLNLAMAISLMTSVHSLLNLQT